MKTVLILALALVAAMPLQASLVTKAAFYLKGHADQRKVESLTVMDADEAQKQFPNYTFDEQFYYAVVTDGTSQPLIFEIKRQPYAGYQGGFSKGIWTTMFDQMPSYEALQETGADRGKLWIIEGKNLNGTWVDSTIM